MEHWQKIIRVVLVVLIAATCTMCTKKAEQTSAEWVSLFNGENMDGWTVKIAGQELGDNYKNTYRVEDGVLKVSYDEYDAFDNKFGNIFYEKPFSNYHLRVEYRFVGDQVPEGPEWAFRNSGIMVHSQDPKTMTVEQGFPASIEVQLLGGNGTDERTTGNLCTPATNVVMGGELETTHCINSISQTYHGDQWVICEVVVNGNDSIRHIVNGETVLAYQTPQLDPEDADAKRLLDAGHPLMLDSGYIALQAESHPLEFRKVEIMVLD